MPGAKPGERRGGRKAGVPNKLTVATRERIMELADPFEFMAKVMNGEPIEAAPDKDMPQTGKAYPTTDQRLHAAKWLGERLLPPAKGRTLALNLPAVETAKDISNGLSAVLSAVSAGRISPEEAQVLANVYETKRKALETVDIEERLSKLEERP